MKIGKNITCPLELTHDIIKGKWKPRIILEFDMNKNSRKKVRIESRNEIV